MELMAHPHSTSCGHSACGSCMYKWLSDPIQLRNGRTGCPYCRGTLESRPVVNRDLHRLIDEVVRPHLKPEDREAYERRVKEWEREADAMKAKVGHAAHSHALSVCRLTLVPY